MSSWYRVDRISRERVRYALVAVASPLALGVPQAMKANCAGLAFKCLSLVGAMCAIGFHRLISTGRNLLLVTHVRSLVFC